MYNHNLCNLILKTPNIPTNLSKCLTNKKFWTNIHKFTTNIHKCLTNVKHTSLTQQADAQIISRGRILWRVLVKWVLTPGPVPGWEFRNWKPGFFKITSKVHEMYSNCKNFGHKNWAYDIETLLSKLGIFRNMAQTRNW